MFTVVKPDSGASAFKPLPEGTASMSKAGVLTVHTADLELIKAAARVVVLVDKDNWRLALRAAGPDEAAISIEVRPVKRRRDKVDDRRKQVNVACGVRALGLAVGPELAGRYELTVKDDAVLSLNLMEARDIAGGSTQKGK